jgi:hypothetical protein
MEKFKNQPPEIKAYYLDKAKEKRIRKNKKRLENLKKEKRDEG